MHIVQGHRPPVTTPRWLYGMAVCGLALAADGRRAAGQGVSTAAINGRVTRDSAGGAPAAGAAVTILDRATGARTLLTTASDGRFDAENLPPGGPYQVEARAVGAAAAARGGILLTVGERQSLVLVLGAAAAPTLPTVRVGAVRSIVHDVDRTGPSHTVSDSAVQRLPVLSRDFVDLIQTAPGVVVTSIGGLNNRYNTILVDGAANTDYFGLSRGTGTPGGQEGTRSLPLDAVQEFRVALAPYDVRRGGFTGGEIDAITRSGTNTPHGSAFAFYQDQALLGTDPAGRPAPDFRTYDYGITVGGPVVPDRLHLFVAAEEKQRSVPYAGPLLGPGTPIPADSAARFARLLQGYGINPGSFGPYTTHGLARNLFAKVSAPTGEHGAIDLSVNYADGETSDTLAPGRVDPGDFRSTAAAFAQTGITRAIRGRWTSVFGGRFANELVADELQADEPRTPASTTAGIFVSGVGAAGARLIAGGDPGSQLLALRQRSEELGDNLTVPVGAHAVTVGVHATFLQFRFASLVNSVGQYQFASLSSFAAGTPSGFTRTVPLVPNGGATDFASVLPSAYVEDRWTLPHGVSLTGGLRMDLPLYVNAPDHNPALAASPLGIDTHRFIGATPHLSPRVGVNWQVDDRTAVRGGAGVFAGVMPYNWLSWAYAFTGLRQSVVSCKGANVPHFVPGPTGQPTACTGAAPAPAGAEVVAFDPGFTMPEELKASIGADRALGWGVVASADATFQYALENLTIVNANLRGPIGRLAGEGGRTMYGTVAATSGKGTVATTSPTVVDPAFGPVLINGNASGDRSWVATLQAAKRFANGVELDVAYTYTDALERMSLRDAQTVSNFGFTPLDGSFTDRRLATSTYDVPHVVTVSGTANGPFGSRLSLIYLGRSGYPFTYIVNGDANGDGVGDRVGFFPTQQNDPIYVPRDAKDISLVQDGPGGLVPASAAAHDSLAAFIAAQACLREHEGQLLPRNACRNPWQNILNARIAERVHVPGLRDQGVELMVDVFNVLNLIDRHWGLVRETGTLTGAGTENVPVLTLRGTDRALGRNLYQLSLPPQRVLNVNASRWQLQLAARYAF